MEIKESFPIDELFISVAKKMENSFDGISARIEHKSSKGVAREEIVRQFLGEYLPEAYEIGTGEIVDLKGNRSDQTDLIVFDKLYCPKLIQVGNIRIYPAEGVLAVIEVKTKLNAKSLEDAVVNIQNAKRLEKSAYYPTTNLWNTWTMYGKNFDYFPMMGYIFAYESVGMETICKKLNEMNVLLSIPPEQQVDVVCLLDKGVIAHISKDDKLISWAEPADIDTGETIVTGVKTKHALLLFYLMLHDQLSIAKSRPVQMIRYLPKTFRFGGDEE